MIFDYITPIFFKDNVLWYISLWVLTLSLGAIAIAFSHPLIIFIITRVLTHILDAIVKSIEVALFIIEQFFYFPIRLAWTIFHSIYPKKGTLEESLILLRNHSNDENIVKIIDQHNDISMMNSKELQSLVGRLSYYVENNEILMRETSPSENNLCHKTETQFDMLSSNNPSF